METKLATWQELKQWLNLEFDDNKDSIEVMACGIEGYLSIGTGLILDTLKDDSVIAYVLARDYLQTKLHSKYYRVADENVEKHLQTIIEQLKILALTVVQSAE